MKTEDTLQQLQNKLDYIKTFQSVKLQLPESKACKEHKDKVIKEIKEFIDKRIQEIDDGIEVEKIEQLTKEEVGVLKKIANGILTKKLSVPPPISPVSPLESEDPPGTNLINEVIQNNNKKSKSGVYRGQEVLVMARVGGFASIKFPNGEKEKVPINELQ
jgi:hypothetical protein